MTNDPSAYLKHMRDSARAVMTYSVAHTLEDFSANDWDQAAAIRNLEIIGEAATNIPVAFRDQHSQIPWQDIIDFRNVAIHDYMEVDPNIVWDIIINDVPPLLLQLENLIKNIEKTKEFSML